jgi:hypothetical protein
MLKRLLGVTISAAIEAEPSLPPDVLEEALAYCEGGRLADRKLRARLGDSFLAEQTVSPGILGNFTRRSGATKLWQEWSDMLLRWR